MVLRNRGKIVDRNSGDIGPGGGAASLAGLDRDQYAEIKTGLPWIELFQFIQSWQSNGGISESHELPTDAAPNRFPGRCRAAPKPGNQGPLAELFLPGHIVKGVRRSDGEYGFLGNYQQGKAGRVCKELSLDRGRLDG